MRSRTRPRCNSRRSTRCWSDRGSPCRCRSWCRTLSGRSENSAKTSYRVSSVGLSKGNIIEVLACLSSPILSTIGCAENFSFEESDSCAVIFIAEVYSIEPVGCISRLLHPVVAAISCPQDDALLAYQGSNVGIDEANTEKVQAGKWIAYSAVLAYPA